MENWSVKKTVCVEFAVEGGTLALQISDFILVYFGCVLLKVLVYFQYDLSVVVGYQCPVTTFLQPVQYTELFGADHSCSPWCFEFNSKSDVSIERICDDNVRLTSSVPFLPSFDAEHRGIPQGLQL